jgi:hypothetical protein
MSTLCWPRSIHPRDRAVVTGALGASERARFGLQVDLGSARCRRLSHCRGVSQGRIPMSKLHGDLTLATRHSTTCRNPEEVDMEEISAPESVATDRSRASVGDLSVLISKTRDEVSAYLTQARARQRRLLNVAILAGAPGTALVAPWLLPECLCQTR